MHDAKHIPAHWENSRVQHYNHDYFSSHCNRSEYLLTVEEGNSNEIIDIVTLPNATDKASKEVSNKLRKQAHVP